MDGSDVIIFIEGACDRCADTLRWQVLVQSNYVGDSKIRNIWQSECIEGRNLSTPILKIMLKQVTEVSKPWLRIPKFENWSALSQVTSPMFAVKGLGADGV